MFEIKLDNQPQDFLKKCEKILFERIKKKLEELKTNPIPHDAKKVIGYELPTFSTRLSRNPCRT